MPDAPKPQPNTYVGIGQAFGMAVELVVTTLVGTGLGWLVGRWLGAAWVFLLIGTLLGGAAGINLAYRRWKRQT